MNYLNLVTNNWNNNLKDNKGNLTTLIIPINLIKKYNNLLINKINKITN